MNRIHPLIPDSFRIEKNTHTMTLTWNVICDEPQTPQSIRNMPGVPVYGNSCPLATWLKAASIEWKPIDAWNWQATVQYTNNLNATSSSAGVGGTSKPWNEPPVVRYTPGVEMVVEEKYWYANGKQAPILNPAGDPYDNPPQVPRYFTTIEITWNARRFSNNNVNEFKGTINGKPVTIDARQYPDGVLLLSEITPNKMNDGENTYVSITAQIVHKSYGHNYCPLLIGFRAKEKASDTEAKPLYITPAGKYAFTESGNKAITEPALLKRDGTLLYDGPRPGLDGFYGNYQYLTAKSWSGLAIPTIQGTKERRNGLW